MAAFRPSDRLKAMDMTEPEFPNLIAMRALDREDHIRLGMEAGLTRKEAEKHADDDLRDRHDERP